MASTIVTFQLDRGGVAEVLKSAEVARWVKSVAESVAASARRGTKAPATVSTFTSDRAGATVAVPARLQASEGALTRAAAEHGLVVRSR